MDLEVGGTVVHTTTDRGTITLDTPSKGGELSFSFNPSMPFESQKILAENAVRLLEYAKDLKQNTSHLPPIEIRSGGATAKVG